MRSPRTGRAGSGLALLLALLLGTACRDEPSEVGGAPGPPALQRLDLRPPPGTAPPASRLVRSVVPPADGAGWAVEAREHAFADGALRLEGWRKQQVVVPGPFDPRAFAQVALHVESPGGLTFRLQFRRGGKVALSPTGDLFTPGGDAPRVVFFDLSRARLETAPLDDLVLSVSDVQEPWRLLGVDLIEKPLRAFLPHDGTDLIETAGEARRGTGVSTAAPLAATVEAPPRARLAYAFAWPPAVREPDREAELVVRVATEGREPLELRHALGDLPWDDGPVWRDVDAPLYDLAGRTVDVSFRVEADGPGEVVCAVAEAAVFAPAVEPPTVLLVTSDTHRADHVEGAPRSVGLATPTLRALAERGVAFDDAFSATNVTVPSHVALMTATHVRDTGVLTNRAHLSGDAPTLAEAFRAAGFRTFAVVSNRYLGRVDTGLGQGFDRVAWPRYKTWVAGRTVDRLSEWLPAADGRPVFCWLHVFDAHFPYEPPEDLARAYYASDRDPFSEDLPAADFPVPPIFSGLRDAEFLRAQYKSEVTYLDRELARVLERPRFRDGVVAVTADHGEALGQQGVWWDHAGVYPDTLHVPLILAWPGGPRGLRVTEPVRMIDLGRTLLDAAGVADAGFGGASLLERIAAADGGNGAPGADAPRFALSDHGRQAAVTVDGWHLVLTLEEHPRSRYVPDRVFERHAVTLHHLAEDPDCTSDRTDAEPARAAALRALLVDWLTSAEPTGWGGEGVVDEDVLREIAELGYALDEGPVSALDLFDPDCGCAQCERFREDG